jgi:thiol-disulfide isomerase/thioredoxin
VTTRSLNPGLAVAALVLGIVSVVFSLLVVGALFGLIGLVLGALYLWRHRSESRGMAISGVVLSGTGFVASAGFGVLYYILFTNMLGSVGSGASYANLMSWQGVEAPDFTVTTVDGRAVQLNELRGKRVVVDFWATWCGPCIHEIPDINQFSAEHSPDELVVLGISKEAQPVIEAFMADNEMNYPVASARDLPEPYSLVSGIPTKFFIDRNGVIQTVRFGAGGYDSFTRYALGEDYSGEVRSTPATANE